MAEIKYDVEVLLFQFSKAVNKLAEERSKLILLSLEPIACEVIISDKIIEQVMQIKYLGTTRLTRDARVNRKTEH